MSSTNFQLLRLKNLSPNESKAYITKYFVPLSNGNHAQLIDGVYQVKDDTEIKRAYFNRMSKELCNYYFKDFCDVKTVAYEINKPTFFDDKINLCPTMKYDYNPSYTPSKNTQEKLDFFMNYIFEVLCSKKQEGYDFVLKWLSNMLKGNKNNSCLYLKGPQGVGKSSLFEFLNKFVIGSQLCLETGSDPIRTKFNEILGGKLLVCIEELENFSKAEWESISSTLKRMITSTRINLQNKCTKSYESNNINNYMLCSNNDAIKDDEGRRYFILDISTHKACDEGYFNKLYGECYNDEVGEAFFHYIYSIDTEKFNPQVFPITQSKLDSLSKRLDSVYKFIKESFILTNEDINISCSELYNQYKYNFEAGMKKYGREDFHKKMAEVGLIKTLKGKTNVYIFTHQELMAIADKKHWIHELDEYSSVGERSTEKVSEESDSEFLPDDNELFLSKSLKGLSITPSLDIIL
jgi:hypothetical protein